MAKLEQSIWEDFESLVERVTDGVVNGSASASLEDASDFQEEDARCSVRVFERYSYTGSNRVSMSVTFFQVGRGPVQVSAITSGGSQAMLFKINTFGEEAFLNTLEEIL